MRKNDLGRVVAFAAIPGMMACEREERPAAPGLHAGALLRTERAAAR
jgi:hypothetical protein